MNGTIEQYLGRLAAEGNLRSIPRECDFDGTVDFSSNDYLGLSAMTGLQEEFLVKVLDEGRWAMGACASRLLATRQQAFDRLESTISGAYGGRAALLFGSGYHANTGIVAAIADKNTTIVADRLVHASIIDGIRLSGAKLARFRHNDLGHLASMAGKEAAAGRKVVIIAESVYSMDGDSPDIAGLVDIKRSLGNNAFLMVDEAHAIGVSGQAGLGLCKPYLKDVDIMVGTFGKALASAGAFAVCSQGMREYLVNRCRSLIFSTSQAPITAMWSELTFSRALEMDTQRAHLRDMARRLAESIGSSVSGHIQCVIVGDPAKAVEMSHKLRNDGLCVLPVRTPTVPPGTDRLRISLSAARAVVDIDSLAMAINRYSR